VVSSLPKKTLNRWRARAARKRALEVAAERRWYVYRIAVQDSYINHYRWEREQAQSAFEGAVRQAFDIPDTTEIRVHEFRNTVTDERTANEAPTVD